MNSCIIAKGLVFSGWLAEEKHCLFESTRGALPLRGGFPFEVVLSTISLSEISLLGIEDYFEVFVKCCATIIPTFQFTSFACFLIIK